MNRNPLVNRAVVVAVVALGVVLLRHAGVVVPADVHEAVIEAVAVAAPIVAALWARRKVTPTADPRAEDGTPLAPVTPETAPSAIEGDEAEAVPPDAEA